MTSKPHLIDPTDPLLNQPAQEVATNEIGTSAINALIDRMIEMAAGKGHDKDDSRQMVGLAAVQVGAPKRIVLIDLAADGSPKLQDLLVIINPSISVRSEEELPGREGCWSCGNICGNVDRAESVTLTGLDRTGKPLSIALTGFVARIAQHETDHLDGIRFPDRIPEDQPERLHLVRTQQFESYRQNWQHWPILCPRSEWIAMKAGDAPTPSNAI